MKSIITLLILFCCISCQHDMLLPHGFKKANRTVHVSDGKIISLSVASKEMGRNVDVDIWLPSTYNSTDKASPVLYMHDGQNLFDYNITWNHQTWNVDSVLYNLKDSFIIPIVVGIYSKNDSRFVDYLPANYISTIQNEIKKFESNSNNNHNSSQEYEAYFNKNVKPFIDKKNEEGKLSCNSQSYIDFITNTLKPFVDSTFNVLTDKDNTFIMGSSMGALVSIFALQYAPDVFGTAIGMSYPASIEFWHIQKQTWLTYSQLTNNARLYIDNGTGMLDSTFFPQFLEIEPILRNNNWDNQHLLVKVFPNADHTEKFWMERLHIPFQWVLPRK